MADEKPYWLNRQPPTTVARVRADADDILRLIEDALATFPPDPYAGLTLEATIEASSALIEARDLAQRLDENITRLEEWIVDNLPEAAG